MADDPCPICLEPIAEAPPGVGVTLEECRHRFHAACLVGWMRQGHLSCPTCRGDMRREPAAEHLSSMSLAARARHLRAVVARRRAAPDDLRRLVGRLREAEARRAAARREVARHAREHRAVFARERRLRDGHLRAYRRVAELTRLLGLFEGGGLRLPAVQIVHFHA